MNVHVYVLTVLISHDVYIDKVVMLIVFYSQNNQELLAFF